MSEREHVEPADLRPMAEGLVRRWTDLPIRFVRNFMNLVYEIPREAGSWYLRITPETHRSNSEIASELELIHFLGSRDLPASQPVPSRSRELVHGAHLNGVEYSACVFEEAPGLAYSELTNVNSERFFRAVGRTMGALHQAAQKFERPSDFIRSPWKTDRWHRFGEIVPRSETEAWALYEELDDWIREQPKDASHFGLIHGDFTIANLRIQGDYINLFDFDSCCDHWYAYEIAMFLHYFGARPEMRRTAYESVLDGYGETRTVDTTLLGQIPVFGKMRLLYSFLVFAEEWGFERLSEQRRAYFDVRRRLFQAVPTWPMP